jgi:tight adherence protein B
MGVALQAHSAVTVALVAAALVPALSSAGARRRVRARLDGALHAPGSPSDVPARTSMPVVVVGAVGLATAWFALGPPAVAGLGALAAAGPVRARLRRRVERRRRRADQLPVALDRLAAALRSGSSLPMAFDEVGTALDPPLGPELRALGREAAGGRPVVQVLDDWSAAHDDPGTRLASTALVLAALVGSAPARAIDGVAATVRERLDLAAERHALAAQARTSALVLSVAPVGFAGLLVVGDTAAADFLLGTPAGWACLAVGLGLDAGGAWWMARLSRSETW